MWMTGQERKIAKKLGANWVKVRPHGLMEVCLGGPGCGCGEADGPQGRAAAEDRPHSHAPQEPTEEPLRSAG